MPRKPTDQIITHRIELSPFERDLIKPIMLQREIQGQIKSVAMVGGAAALGIAGWAFYNWVKQVTGWADDAGDWFKDTFVGSKPDDGGLVHDEGSRPGYANWVLPKSFWEWWDKQ